ncbi:malate:quinone oxidoreductase, partial [Pseudomonas asplenii]|uniref:malate:quinone oxidoreductase n=1 Tax=Pseudomonas asplenii TaxID=53407 RepID=UPI00178C2F8E
MGFGCRSLERPGVRCRCGVRHRGRTRCCPDQGTRQYVAHLQAQPNFKLKLSSEVQASSASEDGSWRVTYKEPENDGKRKPRRMPKFVFIGAGGV